MLLALIRFARHWVGLAYFVSHGADLVRSGGEDGVDDAGGGCVGVGRRRRRRAAAAASSSAGRVGTSGWRSKSPSSKDPRLLLPPARRPVPGDIHCTRSSNCSCKLQSRKGAPKYPILNSLIKRKNCSSVWVNETPGLNQRIHAVDFLCLNVFELKMENAA